HAGAGVPLRYLLRAVLLSVLSVVRLLWWRVLLRRDPLITSRLSRRAEDCPPYRCVSLYLLGRVPPCGGFLVNPLFDGRHTRRCFTHFDSVADFLDFRILFFDMRD